MDKNFRSGKKIHVYEKFHVLNRFAKNSFFLHRCFSPVFDFPIYLCSFSI